MPHQPKADELERAAHAVRSGELVAFPTETVYGLGADALNARACAKIFEAKNRPYFDPLIVHVASFEEACQLWSKLDPRAAQLAKHFWPGPLTIVLLKAVKIPDLVTAGLATVAVRVPAHPVALELLKHAQRPIAAPSANPFGYISPTTAEHVRTQLGAQVPVILDGGPCVVGVESTILDLSAPQARLLRPGGVPVEALEALIGPVVLAEEENRPEAPGQLPSHYAPRAKLILIDDAQLCAEKVSRRVGLLAFKDASKARGYASVEVLSKSGDLAEAAANLFAALRRLDAAGLEEIHAQAVPETGLGRAIMNRLKKAAGPR